MKMPSLPQSASVVVTAGVGAFVAYLSTQCQVSAAQLVYGGAMAAVAAIVHLYMAKPGTVQS